MQILEGKAILELWEWLLLMCLLAVLRFIFMFWKVRLSERWVYRTGASVVGWFLHTLRNLSSRNFHTPEGERAVEAAYESTQVLQANGSVCFQAVQAGLQLIVFLPVLFYISWPLTLFLFVVVVPLIAWVQRKLHRMGPEEESLLEARSGFRQDLRLTRTLYNRWSSHHERERVSADMMHSVRNLRDRGLSASIRKGGLSLFTETVSVLAMVLVLAFCAMLISKGWMDGSGLVLFCSAVLLCYKPVKECARVMPSMRAAGSAYSILLKFGKMPKRSGSPMPADSNGLRVEGGSFQYEGTEAPLFSHLSFSWDSSKPVLLRGHNGVGKSTLLRLAAGLEEWQGQSSHSRDVFFVAQDLELPPRYLLQELLAKKSAVAKTNSVLDEFVCKSGAGALLAKKGLSGGERARLALLWALASNSKMLLLDEPFASVALDDRAPLLSAFLDAASALGKWTIVVSHDVLAESLESRFHVVKMETLLGESRA